MPAPNRPKPNRLHLNVLIHEVRGVHVCFIALEAIQGPYYDL